MTRFRQVAPGFRQLSAWETMGRVRVVVERSGGFAGVVRRGEADATQLDDATSQQLRDLVASAAGPDGSSEPGRGPRRDGFCYEVTLEDDDDDAVRGPRRVLLREGSMPAGARQLLDGLLG